ncbi:hypothetical protein ACI3L3_11925 [Desulfobaculum sp. SPO524]|uniref:hypothetical protein n=1 Tax=Desulfobaculum sp. SPO524 TaxID=3378071 RepID=UPI003854E512
MMINELPRQIAISESTSCRILLGLPASEGWAATLALRGQGSTDVEGVADGDAFVFSFVCTLPAGRHWWQIIATRGDEQRVVQSGKLEVVPNFLGVGGPYDGRTEAEKALEAVDAALSGCAGDAVWSYQIAGRQLQRYSIDQLRKLRGQLVVRVRSERGQNGFKTIGVRL